jgi:hypothetical protein
MVLLVRTKRARGRTIRGTSGTALKLHVAFMDRMDRTGHVRITNSEIARAIGVTDPNTVRSNVQLLVEAGLLYPPTRTHDQNGYINGMDYALRPDSAAYSVTDTQQILPFKSSTSSSAPSAPRPLTPAKWKFVILACWTVFEAQPDMGLDVASVRTWLTQQGAETTDAIIERAITVQAWQYRQAQQRQRPLPLVGEAPGTRGRPQYVTPPHPSIGTDRLWRRLYAEQDALKERSA